jgi:hypothetical protein
MLAEYGGKPAFFYQKSPPDTDGGWQKPCYPRADYNIDMRYDPERKVSGTMDINVWCITESEFMPEEIEKSIVSLINGTFYSGRVCAVWNRSDAYNFEARGQAEGSTAPEGIGVTISFDLMEFPEQISGMNPDPVRGLNLWTKENFPDIAVIAHDEMPEIWMPTDENPAVYWRFEGATVNDKQTYAADWYTGQFAAHIAAATVNERNKRIREITEKIQVYGEVILPDGSPMFAKQIAIRHNADPLREGQLALTGRYGVLAQPKKETQSPPLGAVKLNF